MTLAYLNFQQSNTQVWTARKAAVGGSQGTQNANQIGANILLGTQAANAVAGGSDEMYSLLSTIALSSTLTINLQSFTDLLGQTTISLARLKFIRFKLFGSAELAPDGTAGTACSGVQIGKAVSAPNLLFMATDMPDNITPSFLVSGGAYGDDITYANGGVLGIAVTSGAKNILITNLDGALAAKLLIEFVGGTS